MSVAQSAGVGWIRLVARSREGAMAKCWQSVPMRARHRSCAAIPGWTAASAARLVEAKAAAAARSSGLAVKRLQTTSSTSCGSSTPEREIFLVNSSGAA